jgi:hypothetical protein
MSLNHSKRPTIYAKMKRPEMDTEWYRTNWTNQQTVHFGMQTAGQGQVTTANTTEWHPQVNYETSGYSTASTWAPPRWSHQSISLSVAPGLSPKIVGAKRCHWNHASGSHDAQLTLLTVKILNQLTQLTLQGLQCIFLAYEGHHRLLRSAFPDPETGQVSCADANMVRSRHVNRRGCK